MENHPNITCRQNIVFIIIWNVAGKFINLKNMTVGSKSPSSVRKAAFHSSPGLMRMLLYPHWMSNLVNREHPVSLLTTNGMRGKTFRFFFVHLFNGGNLELVGVCHLSS